MYLHSLRSDFHHIIKRLLLGILFQAVFEFYQTTADPPAQQFHIGTHPTANIMPH